MTLPIPTDISSYAKMHLGGENWDVLVMASNYGQSFVELSIDTIKRRILLTWVSTAGEPALDPRLLNYLGLCTALDLVSACRAAWMSRSYSSSLGNDPVEIETLTDRSRRMDDLRDDLMLKLPTIQAVAIPFLDQPLIGVGSRPAIDELDDCKVTDDPRAFPPASSFPYQRCR